MSPAVLERGTQFVGMAAKRIDAVFHAGRERLKMAQGIVDGTIQITDADVVKYRRHLGDLLHQQIFPEEYTIPPTVNEYGLAAFLAPDLNKTQEFQKGIKEIDALEPEAVREMIKTKAAAAIAQAKEKRGII
jgi:hypothetical protein